MKWLRQNGEGLIASIAFAIMVVMVVANVALRYVAGTSLGATEEIAYLGFAYAVFFGASQLYRKRALITLEFIVDMFPTPLRNTILVLNFILLGCVNGYMAYLTWILAEGSLDKKTPFLDLPYTLMYIPAFISFSLMSLYSFVFLVSFLMQPESFRPTNPAGQS